MTATKLDGVVTATAIKSELRARVSALREKGVVPGLGTLLVGSGNCTMYPVTAGLALSSAIASRT